MPESHTFIIEIPRELQLTPGEISTLEGHFQVDAGNLLDQRVPNKPPDFTNASAVRVVTRLQSADPRQRDDQPPENPGK